MPTSPTNWGAGGGGGSGAAPTYATQPTAQKLLAWTYDPISADGVAAQNLGALYLCRIDIPISMTVANLVAQVDNNLVTPSGVVAGALYDGSGHQAAGGAGVKIAHTADQSANWGTTGQKVMPLTPEAGASLSLVGGAGVWIYGCTLEVGGASSVGFAQAGNTGHNNIGMVAADGYRFAFLGGQVSLPASFAFASCAESNRVNWYGLS